MKKNIVTFLCLLLFSAANSGAYGPTKFQVSTTASTPIYLFNNQKKVVPIKGLAERAIASINIGSENALVFDSLLSKYAAVKHFESSSYLTDSLSLANLTGDYLKFYNTLIIQVTSHSLNDAETIKFITANQKRKDIIIAGFGELSALKKLDFFNGPIVWSTSVTAEAANQSAQLIFGGIAASRTLKQNISAKYKVGSGYITQKTRLRYASPESVGIKSSALDSIDMIAAEAIREKATPSAVVLAIKNLP